MRRGGIFGVQLQF